MNCRKYQCGICERYFYFDREDGPLKLSIDCGGLDEDLTQYHAKINYDTCCKHCRKKVYEAIRMTIKISREIEK